MTTELLSRNGVQRRQGGLREYVSYSRLALWLSCPLAFKFKYVEGIAVPSSPAAFLGKQVHAGLETFYRHRQLGVALDFPDISRRLYDTWERAVADEGIRFASAQEEKNLQQQALTLVRAYLQILPRNESPPLAV